MKDSFDFETAYRVAEHAKRFARYKLCSQKDWEESQRLSETLGKIKEHMEDATRICWGLEKQLAMKRGKFLRVYGEYNTNASPL